MRSHRNGNTDANVLFEEDSSVGALPSSITTRSINDVEQDHKRIIKWGWRQPAIGLQHNSTSETKHEKFCIVQGDHAILFGVKRKIDRTGQEPIDGNEDYVYSEELGAGPYSFFDNNAEFDKAAPPPLYIKFEVLNKPKDTKKNKILKTFSLNEEGFLECTDENIKESNKGVIPYVLKQLAKNILTGQGLVSISLPVRIFQPKSLLERIIDAISFVPTFFSKACKTNDEVLRMKYVISFIVSGLYMSADLRKPFNPILGETFEGYFKDGTRIYMEHTCHHPPISSYLVEGTAEYPFRMYGSVEFKGNIKNAGNTLFIFFEGANYVEFPDGHIIEFHYPINKV
mmetsp:Transcript_3057/g.3739  ORF Transcript_3057/g.3739 Transcript_3057/m.3739 type:complete len:342 (+) Transcript_3057:205-1230(+)